MHKRFGKRPPRYLFILNPHGELRLSRCTKCGKLTYPRKFPLFILVKDVASPMVLGKTCRYCSKCEIIICHQDELDAELAHAFAHREPSAIGNDYIVVGTFEKAVWKASVEGKPPTDLDPFAHLADFKSYLSIDYDPGGYRLPDARPEQFVITADRAASRRDTPWTRAAKRR